jgi:hypothetical protein
MCLLTVLWVLQPVILKSVFDASILIPDFYYPLLLYQTGVRACTSMVAVGGEYSGNNNGGSGNCWL